jgi:ATP-dependent protease ClpP protease subunit
VMTRRSSRLNQLTRAHPQPRRRHRLRRRCTKPNTRHVTRRQELIKKIQSDTNCRLICYVAGPSASISREDTLGFVDLLHNVAPRTDLDLLLHTAGGDIDAADKLITLVSSTVGDARLRVIVPDYAKSAGTLMAMGADKILMSDTSELGPIDPQIIMDDGNGNLIQRSVQTYLDAFKTHSEALRKDPSDPVARLMLNKLDPGTLKLFEAVCARATKFAEDQLKFRPKIATYTAVATNFIDVGKWLTHGQMISWQAATYEGLSNVEYLDFRGSQWRSYWQLYCLQRLVVKDREKLFESDYASFLLDS